MSQPEKKIMKTSDLKNSFMKNIGSRWQSPAVV
jgi:hypothetical protein